MAEGKDFQEDVVMACTDESGDGVIMMWCVRSLNVIIFFRLRYKHDVMACTTDRH